MNTIWIKHEKLCKILIALTFICLFIGIGRVLFPYYAQQTKFSGSIVGWYWNTERIPRFIIKDPNHLERETIFDVSDIVPEGFFLSFVALTKEGLYFRLIGTREETYSRIPQIMCLTEKDLRQVPVIWPDTTDDLISSRLYVYPDKFYLLFASKDRSLPYKVYSIPKEGGEAKEIYDDLSMRSFGDDISQKDGAPLQYKDGLICIRQNDSVLVFVNDEGEEPLFPLPVGTAKLLKGWYEEGKSILLWSRDPNYAVVVNLQGEVLFELYRSWFLSSSCWDVHGNATNGILFTEASLVDFGYFPGFYALDFFRKERVRHFDSGIYDTRTGNMIPLYWKNQISPTGWSKVDYDPDFFERLLASAKRNRAVPSIVDKQ
ncbi:hypothetical protein QCO44_05330 [Selenomonas sputigena]|uniref:Lipoprotein n=1 Tax=Selenomonas sputigena TaxID=69823 RepID=A0ABV3X4F1_9FIRM